jgi:hypothetical protein
MLDLDADARDTPHEKAIDEYVWNLMHGGNCSRVQTSQTIAVV